MKGGEGFHHLKFLFPWKVYSHSQYPPFSISSESQKITPNLWITTILWPEKSLTCPSPSVPGWPHPCLHCTGLISVVFHSSAKHLLKHIESNCYGEQNFFWCRDFQVRSSTRGGAQGGELLNAAVISTLTPRYYTEFWCFNFLGFLCPTFPDT